MSETRGSASLRCIRRSKQSHRAKLCGSASCQRSEAGSQRSEVRNTCSARVPNTTHASGSVEATARREARMVPRGLTHFGCASVISFWRPFSVARAAED